MLHSSHSSHTIVSAACIPKKCRQFYVITHCESGHLSVLHCEIAIRVAWSRQASHGLAWALFERQPSAHAAWTQCTKPCATPVVNSAWPASGMLTYSSRSPARAHGTGALAPWARGATKVSSTTACMRPASVLHAVSNMQSRASTVGKPACGSAPHTAVVAQRRARRCGAYSSEPWRGSVRSRACAGDDA